jgi:hypothetical protein
VRDPRPSPQARLAIWQLSRRAGTLQKRSQPSSPRQLAVVVAPVAKQLSKRC